MGTILLAFAAVVLGSLMLAFIGFGVLCVVCPELIRNASRTPDGANSTQHDNQ